MCLLLHYCSPLPRFLTRLALLHHLLVAALLTRIDCVGFSTFFNHHRRNLPVPDNYFTASVVAPIDGFSWFSEGARHEGYFLCFFLADCQCLTFSLGFLLILPESLSLFEFWSSALSLCGASPSTSLSASFKLSLSYLAAFTRTDLCPISPSRSTELPSVPDHEPFCFQLLHFTLQINCSTSLLPAHARATAIRTSPHPNLVPLWRKQTSLRLWKMSTN